MCIKRLWGPIDMNLSLSGCPIEGNMRSCGWEQIGNTTRLLLFWARSKWKSVLQDENHTNYPPLPVSLGKLKTETTNYRSVPAPLPASVPAPVPATRFLKVGYQRFIIFIVGAPWAAPALVASILMAFSVMVLPLMWATTAVVFAIVGWVRVRSTMLGAGVCAWI